MGRDPWIPRKAEVGDIPEIERLIALSVRGLHGPYYSPQQIDASIGTVFGVDRQLIADGTYFVVEADGQIIGCGGWSRRASLCGSDSLRTVEDPLVDPRTDPARVRAFFVHPSWVRRGVGSSIMERCEREIARAGFGRVVIMATLAGEALYASFGYRSVERIESAMPGGLSIAVIRMERAVLRGAVQAP
jgi:N-acetylglutamate synthase-like GNAT family acetyltransferase